MGTLDATATLLQLLAEPSRVRLLALLARDELTVNELVGITALAQSRVSTHLGRLKEAGLVRDRRAGASTFYSLNDGEMPDEARRLWDMIATGLDDGLLEADRQRAASVLRARQGAGRWADSVAGEMERHYSPGRTWEAVARGLVGLLRLGDVLDAGSGDGAIAELLAPRAHSLTCLDSSEKLISAARARLSRFENVRCEAGDLETPPFRPACFDQVLMLNVLTHVAHPARALAALGRLLRSGGTLVVVTLAPHEHQDVTAAYGHVRGGFAPSTLRRMLEKAGLRVDACEVTARERRPPYFQVVTAFANKEPER